jgi:hypothetical protein
MSSTSLRRDKCTYTHDLRQSIGPGNYMLDHPRNDCRECFYPDPTVRLGTGASRCENSKLVDVDSELIGIGRKASRCPADHYLPGTNDYCESKKLQDCSILSTEDTRLSNPPCTLRGIENGFNRWEWLCTNPQDAAIIPFNVNINYRLVVKDNHRPCIEKPLDPAVLPPQLPFDHPKWCTGKADTTVPNMHWRRCEAIDTCKGSTF